MRHQALHTVELRTILQTPSRLLATCWCALWCENLTAESDIFYDKYLILSRKMLWIFALKMRTENVDRGRSIFRIVGHGKTRRKSINHPTDSLSKGSTSFSFLVLGCYRSATWSQWLICPHLKSQYGGEENADSRSVSFPVSVSKSSETKSRKA